MASTNRKQHYLALKVDSGEPKEWEEHVVGLLSRHCSAEEGAVLLSRARPYN